MDVKTAAKLLNLSEDCIRKQIKAGKIPARREPSKDGGYDRYVIDDKFICTQKVLGYGKPQPQEQEQAGTCEQPQQAQQPQTREIIVDTDKALSKEDAERIIKQEDAIRKQRENLEIAGKIIRLEEIEESLTGLFSGLLSTLENRVDSWQIKYNLSAEQANEMVNQYRLDVINVWNKLKSESMQHKGL